MAVQATRRQLLGWGGAALAGAAVSGLSLPSLLKSASAAPAPSQGGGLVSAATATASSSATPALTPSPTPATVTIPVPVIQQSMVLDCETAALQQGLASVAHPVTGLLSGVVGKVWQTVRHWLQGLLQEEPEEQSRQRQQGREAQQQPGQQSGQRAPAAAAA